MTILHEVPDVIAVLDAAHRSVGSPGQDQRVAPDDRPDLCSFARRAGGDLSGDAHEILVPIDTPAFGHAPS
jgi:hypothetical protein